jgi:hypothetical protein
MALDPRYVVAIDLCETLFDKDSGEPLANGYVQLWQDSSRTTPKLAYELSGSPPNYTYTALPNPIVLSNTGNFQDAAGNNIAVYYFPYDSFNADANLQLYYIAVFNADGVEQFTREAWPNVTFEEVEPLENSNFSNQISNSQFSNVLFDVATGLTISFTGTGTTTVNIAPGWTLVVGYGGTGTVTVAQNAIAGSAQWPNNAPFSLSIVAGTNVGSLTLTQTISNDPAIWAPNTLGLNGWVATNITLDNLTAINGISYVPSSGAPTVLLPATNNNTEGKPFEFTSVVQLPAPTSGDTGATGSVNIVINIPVTGTTTFSNVQVVGVNNNVQIAYAQDTVARQTDFLFHYYKPKLEFKPIPSYLVGWDFPLNPAQFPTPSQTVWSTIVAQSVGANKSYYAWDQTIIFQTANSGVTITRDATGGLKTLSAPSGGTQLALIQYIPAPQAIEMLSRRKCVNISANASVATGATVSLWYIKVSGGNTLPSTVGSNNSIVATLDANGYPATQNSTWVPVPRSGLGTGAGLNGAQLTIGTSANASFNQYPLSGWDMQGLADINSATFFAIVVGTAELTQNSYIVWQSISCQDGDIPTVPAPKTVDETIKSCQRYYWSTFAPKQLPKQALGTGSGEYTYLATVANSGPELSPAIPFPTTMYAIPTTVTTYSPGAATANVYDETASADLTTPLGVSNVSQNGFYVFAQGVNSSTVITHVLGVHFGVDARIGQ